MNRVLVCIVVCLSQAGVVAAQRLAFEPPAASISSDSQLLLEQASQSAGSGNWDESLSLLTSMLNQASLVQSGPGLAREADASGLVLASSEQSAGTLVIRNYVPLAHWLRGEIVRRVAQAGAVGDRYQANLADASARAYAEQQSEMDVVAIADNARRFAVSDQGWRHDLMQADVCLERGWAIAAMQAVLRVCPEMRFVLSNSSEQTGNGGLPSGGLPWYLVQSHVGNQGEGAQVVEGHMRRLAESLVGSSRAAESSRRMLLAAEIAPEQFSVQAIRSWLSALAVQLSEVSPEDGRALKVLLAAADTSGSRTGQSPEVSLANRQDAPVRWNTIWPTWSWTLDRYSASSDSGQASKPRGGELELAGLCYHPSVIAGTLYLNELTRITAIDLTAGSRTASSGRTAVIFDSGTSPDAYLPLAHPVVGVPRGHLDAAVGCLYARMGSPVTGWGGDGARADSNPRSYVVGLDLKAGGKMLPGFPLKLVGPKLAGYEFEGPPLVWGELLIVAVGQRDNVGLHRRLMAFDRFSGELKWRSAILASGVVPGLSHAHQIACQMLTLVGGRLFYNTNLGSIVCLDPATGGVEWLSQYSRPDSLRQAVPTPDRYLYRDQTPCLVTGGMVVCLPSDCPECFALDATSGDLVWSTHAEDVPDALHSLGVSGEQLILSGDRIVWLDRTSGRTLARFPGSATPAVLAALPSPRGLGRGAIAGRRVLFPVAGEILVFDAQQFANSPYDSAELGQVASENMGIPVAEVVERLPLGSRGSEGANLLVEGGRLIVATPSRLMLFEQDK